MVRNREIKKPGNSFKRLNVDKRMMSILVVFVVLGIFMLASIVVTTNSLSALRGFASFQTVWTSARKEAAFQLVNYLKTKDEQYKTKFDSSLQVIKKAEHIRHELLKDDTDRDTVRTMFLETYTIPFDVDRMITTFENFHDFPDFKESIAIWDTSDRLIKDLELISATADSMFLHGSPSEAEIEDMIKQAVSLDAELTGMQFRLSRSLASGTQFLNFIIYVVTVTLAVILIVTGGALLFRFMSSLGKWKREIEFSEQQFRSLFDHNPNAVFSVSMEGKIMDANAALEKTLGYSLEVIKRANVAQFIKKSELDKVLTYFELTVKGEPQTYETVVLHHNHNEVFVEVTTVPIIIDGVMQGVYGIVHDITERKLSDKVIKDQLVEKTHLLSEIHDRVKNNLALVSTLIQLQHNALEHPELDLHYQNTLSRIRSMALIHEQLYHNENFSSIKINDYIKTLTDSLIKKYQINPSELELNIEVEEVVLGIRQAIPTGLLLNELLTNAFKHGLKDGKGTIGISLKQQDGHIRLQVVDHGVGLPVNYDFKKPKTLGLRLVSVLIKQLQADMVVANSKGVDYNIHYKIQDIKTQRFIQKPKLALN